MSSMIRVLVRCYAELNDLLPPELRFRDIAFHLPAPCTVADVLQRAGTPESQVDVALCNGTSVTPDTVLADGDRLSVYPVFETFDVSAITRMRDRALRTPAFVADVHLGSLARFLRMLGFDTVYERTSTTETIIAISMSEGRVLLSRSRTLVRDPRVSHCLFIPSPDPRTQLIEVIRHHQLASSIRPFARCIECNDPVAPIDRETVLSRLPASVRSTDLAFRICRRCDRVYWDGSHVARMRAFIDQVIAESLHG